MKLRYYLLLAVWLLPLSSHAWGFFAHQRINRMAIFTLPPEMMILYKTNIEFIAAHSVDPDRLRYVVASEGAHHYMDMNRYGIYPFSELPRDWPSAVKKYTKDTLQQYGIVPWHAARVCYQLTAAFSEKNRAKILKQSAWLGHYVADLHVPLHTHSNYNGQFTRQEGIHALWESRIPELLADTGFDFFVGKAEYIQNPADFIWNATLESAAAADSVLGLEKSLSRSFPADQKYVFEERNKLLVKNYSLHYAKAYTAILQDMVERRMRASIHAVASLWYTAWVNAGQPDLRELAGQHFNEEEQEAFRTLNESWLRPGKMADRMHE